MALSKDKVRDIIPMQISGMDRQNDLKDLHTDYIVKSPWAPCPVPPDVTLTDLLLRQFAKSPNKTALVDLKNGETLNYSKLGETVKALAESLHKHGVSNRTMVSICSPNSLEMGTVLLAVPATGAIISPLNHQLTKAELERLMIHSSSEYLITTPELLPNFKDVIPSLKQVFIMGEVAGLKSVRDLIMEGNPAKMPVLNVDPRQHPAIMSFSSGTTGLPKGVVLTHYNLISGLVLCFDTSNNCQFMDSDDVVVNVFPFAHIAGIKESLMGALYAGATLILPEKFDFEEYLQTIERYKATTMFIPPPVCVRLLNDPIVKRYNLSSVKAIVSGAAPISAVLQTQLIKHLKLETFRQAYGLTETTGCSHTDTKKFKIGAVGLALPNTMSKIVNPHTGEVLLPTSTGEICIKGPMIMLEYWKNPKSTTATKVDGWIRSGDIGHHDVEGYLYVTDRCKDLIKYKGFQVAPAELEGLLLGHPLVADAAVIGIPDEQSGEVPRGFIVLQQGVPEGAATEKSIMKYVSEHVAPFKQLRGGIQFEDMIPKLASGKILRRLLKQQYVTSKSKL